MSTTILNFKKVEVVAASREEAIAQVENAYFHVNGDATQAFKNWKQKQTGGVTERAIKEFMLEYPQHGKDAHECRRLQRQQ